jgi:hypothetical protein
VGVAAIPAIIRNPARFHHPPPRLSKLKILNEVKNLFRR